MQHSCVVCNLTAEHQVSIAVFFCMFLLLCSETSLFMATNTKFEMEVDTVRGGMLQVLHVALACALHHSPHQEDQKPGDDFPDPCVLVLSPRAHACRSTST